MHGPEIEIRWEARFPVPVQFGPDETPASNVYRVFLGVKRPGLGVDNLPLLAPRLRIVGATPPPHPSVPAHTYHGGTFTLHTRVGILIVATIYLQLIQNRYMFRSFTVLQCSHQHCVQPVASDVEVVGYL